MLPWPTGCGQWFPVTRAAARAGRSSSLAARPSAQALEHLLAREVVVPDRVCHSCESGLISGTVSYQPEPLEQPADGNLLICRSQPRDEVILDL